MSESSTPLPDLRPTHPDYAERYAAQVFGERLIAVLPLPDHTFRAVFAVDYFTIQAGNTAPSKSQWNTLKKRMKRVNRGVFVLKQTGTVQHQGTDHPYIDFGFLSDP